MPTALAVQQEDDFSTFLAFISLILSYQSSHIDINRNLSKRRFADHLSMTAIYIATVSNVIELVAAKDILDELMSRRIPTTKRQIKAAKDLVTSRVFSVLASIYLIKSTITSQSETIQEEATPNVTGGIS